MNPLLRLFLFLMYVKSRTRNVIKYVIDSYSCAGCLGISSTRVKINAQDKSVGMPIISELKRFPSRMKEPPSDNDYNSIKEPYELYIFHFFTVKIKSKNNSYCSTVAG